MVRVSIEGNIGCGKSTQLRLCAERLNVPTFAEPVDEWEPLLSEFYKDRSRWGFTLNMRVLLSYLDNRFNQTCVVERSPYSGRYVFTQVGFSEGAISEKEWALYREYHDRFAWAPDVVIYIRTDPDTCFQRIQQRGRKAEAPVSYDYIRKLDFQYENMIKYFPGTCHIVDGTQDPETVFASIRAIVTSALSQGPSSAGA